METPKLKETLITQGLSEADAQIAIDLSVHIAKEVGTKISEMSRTAPRHMQHYVIALATVLVNGVTERLMKS